MSYHIYKQTYSERQAYRYRITDEAGQVHYLAEPTGVFLPNPTRLITLFDADHNALGRIEPPLPSPWRLGGEYELFVGEQEEAQAVIEERWSLVDLILLRLPRYLIRLGEHTYVARGGRYGERLYEIFLPSSEEEEPEIEELEEGGEPKPEMEELDEAEIREALEQTRRARWGEVVGEITCPRRGPSYTVETEAGPLRQAPLVLTALVIVADMHLNPPPV